MSCRLCGEPATHQLYSWGPYCDRCSDLQGEACSALYRARRLSRRAKAKASKEAKALARSKARWACSPSSVRVHLASLTTRRDPAACGCFAERVTDDPADVTCRKCAPIAAKRPGVIPADVRELACAWLVERGYR